MTVITDTYIPYEFNNKYECLKHVESRCHGLKKSLRFVEMDNEHLELRCPIIGDYIDVFGTPTEIRKLYKMIEENELFSENPI